MNRRDIQILRIHVGSPALTLIMPCDKERIQKRFVELLSTVQIEDTIRISVLGHFEVLCNHIICPFAKATVAIFVNKYAAYLFYVPFEMPEITTCETTFKLDKIVAAMNRMQRYWVFDCSTHTMRLYEGMGNFLIEVDKSHVQIDESGALFDRGGSINSLGDYFEQDRLPLCLVGEAQETYTLIMDAPFRDQVVAQTTNIYDVPVLMQKYFNRRLYEMLEQLKQMKPGVQCAVTLEDIISAARQGQIKTLAFEKGYQLDACEEDITRHVVVQEGSCPFGYQKISLIDQIIESVCSKGGELLIAPDGALQEQGRIVAILR